MVDDGEELVGGKMMLQSVSVHVLGDDHKLEVHHCVALPNVEHVCK